MEVIKAMFETTNQQLLLQHGLPLFQPSTLNVPGGAPVPPSFIPARTGERSS